MHGPFRAPGGDRTFNAVMFLGIGLWFFGVQGLLRGDPVGTLMGAPLVLLGLGLRWPMTSSAEISRSSALTEA